jgi:hypothetical protein
MIRISSRFRPLSRLGTALLIGLNFGSQMADVLTYLRSPTQGDFAVRSDPYVLVEDREGTPLTWDCSKPLPVAVNLKSLPPHDRESVLRDLKSAMSAISSQSSFQLHFAGETDVVPTEAWARRWSPRSMSAPVVVVFGDGTDSDLYRSEAIAVGGFFYGDDDLGQARAHLGYVYVYTEHFTSLKKGAGFMSREALFIHELLHVLGFDHVHRSKWDSIMNPWLSSSWGKIGPGDLEGLRRLAEVGCPSKGP